MVIKLATVLSQVIEKEKRKEKWEGTKTISEKKLKLLVCCLALLYGENDCIDIKFHGKDIPSLVVYLSPF